MTGKFCKNNLISHVGDQISVFWTNFQWQYTPKYSSLSLYIVWLYNRIKYGHIKGQYQNAVSEPKITEASSSINFNSADILQLTCHNKHRILLANTQLLKIRAKLQSGDPENHKWNVQQFQKCSTGHFGPSTSIFLTIPQPI